MSKVITHLYLAISEKALCGSPINWEDDSQDYKVYKSLVNCLECKKKFVK
jgi:hypothetical protein